MVIQNAEAGTALAQVAPQETKARETLAQQGVPEHVLARIERRSGGCRNALEEAQVRSADTDALCEIVRQMFGPPQQLSIDRDRRFRVIE